MKSFAIVIPALALSLSCGHAFAHEPSFQECLEASEFILHAAMSRDNGMPREEFISRVESDLISIQNFPPEYRWFAQDEDDGEFLLGASKRVFDSPQAPQRHQAQFMESCVERMDTTSTQLTPEPDAAVPPMRIEHESRL